MTAVPPAPAFDARTFLELARDLANKDHATQAELRTAMSRAYYAVFLRARERLVARGKMQSTGTGEDHFLVISTLRANNVPHGDQIDRLRLKRTTADYDLAAQVAPKEAIQTVNIATYVYPKL